MAVIVTGITRVAEESTEAFLEVAGEQLRRSREEDGCIHYSCSRSIDDPQSFYWFQAWRDLDAFNAHAESAHAREYRSAFAEPVKVRRAGESRGFYFIGEQIPDAELVAAGFSVEGVPHTSAGPAD